jgi:hypothetical protein
MLTPFRSIAQRSASANVVGISARVRRWRAMALAFLRAAVKWGRGLPSTALRRWASPSMAESSRAASQA